MLNAKLPRIRNSERLLYVLFVNSNFGDDDDNNNDDKFTLSKLLKR